MYPFRNVLKLEHAYPVSAFRKRILIKSCVSGLVCGVQVLPESIVLRMIPPPPQMYPICGVGKLTERKRLLTPLGTVSQVSPASNVLMILPLAPQAKPVVSSTNQTERSVSVFAELIGVHEEPPFIVFQMVAGFPTTV